MSDSTRDEALSITKVLLEELRAWRGELQRERQALLREQRAERRWRVAFQALFVAVPVVASLLYLLVVFHGGFAMPRWFSGPSVGVIRIDGVIARTGQASASRVIPALRNAFADSKVEAVALAIDSPGGSPAEAQRIAEELERLQATHAKPAVAIIGNIGASAAYLIALRAERIYVSDYSLVGSIGAVLSAWDVHRAAERLAIAKRSYASGDLKTMLDPFHPVSPAADSKAKQLVAGVGALFTDELARRRAGRLKDGVRYDTGELWFGAEAIALGLADERGTLESVTTARWPGRPLREFSLAGRPSALSAIAAATADGVQASITQLLYPSLH